MKLKLKLATTGETVNILGKDVSIIGTYESEDKQTKIPLLKCMSDFKWQWLCFTDRLFRPYKYEATEDVPQVIEKLKNWLVDYSPADVKKDVEIELNELIAYINGLDEYNKAVAELAIKEQMKERVSQ